MGGTDAVRRSLGLTGYTRKDLSSSAVKALQQADKTLPSNINNIKLENLPDIADIARQSAEQDLPSECLIAFGGDRLCLVYPRVVSDSRVRSGYLDLVVVPLDIARMECHVARRQIEPNPEHEVLGYGCILQCFLIPRDATGDVTGRGNRVFDIYQQEHRKRAKYARSSVIFPHRLAFVRGRLMQ